MGSCFSKKASPSSSSSSSSTIKPTDFNKSAIDNSTKPQEKLLLEQPKPTIESIQQTEPQENDEKTKKKEALLIQNHRRSHERSKTTTDQEEEEEDSTASDEKSTNSNQKTVDVDAILIQCGRMSRSNSAAAAAVASSAAKTRRYSGSKRSFDFDQNNAEEADAEEEDESERRNRRNRSRGGGDSPRDRRRRTPSREREDSKSYRSGSRERVGGGGGSRRVSRSPGRRSDLNPNPNSSSAAVSGNSVNSNNNNKKPARFVSVPATEKINNNNGETSSNKRITVKRNNGGKAAATVAASPRSQSPARAASPRSQSPARAAASYAQPSPSKLSRKTELSPYRRNPLVEIDTNSLTIQPQKKKMMNKESENTQVLKLSTKTATQALTRRTVSPSRVIKETVGEECKTVLSSKPQVMSRSRSLRKSRDFDFSPETLLSNNNVVVATGAAALPSSYTALLLEDIQNFHQKSVHVNAISSSVSKACSIIEAVSDLNSTTNQQSRTEFKSDLMEPSFEKYVTVKRGCVSSSLKEDMEAQQEESSGSNSYVVAQRHGNSWEPNSAESTDRVSVVVRSNKQEGEFDPLKKNGVDSCSSKQTKTTTTTSRVGVVSV